MTTQDKATEAMIESMKPDRYGVAAVIIHVFLSMLASKFSDKEIYDMLAKKKISGYLNIVRKKA